MPLGWSNPLPMKLGGKPSLTQVVHKALRQTHGLSFSPYTELAIGPVEGLRDLYTKCEARVIAAALSKWEHALWQAFPHTATSFIPLWEDMLLVAPSGSLYERQAAVAEKYTRSPDATVPGLRVSLKRIDERFDVEQVPYESQYITVQGRMFGPLAGASGSPYGSGASASVESTYYPNFSDVYIERVRYDGVPTETIIAKAADMLDDVLPAWMDFTIYNVGSGPDGDGLYFDGGPNNDSFFDVTAQT